MKLRINLYADEFRPKRLWCSLPQLLLIWVTVLLLILSCALYLQYRLRSQQQATQALELSFTTQQQEVERLNRLLEAHKPDASLAQQVAEHQSELETKQSLLDNLAGRNLLKSQGFALVLEELARIRSPEIALQRIQLQGERISLQGLTSRSQEVPAWLNRFAGTRGLSGRRFDELLMSRDSQGNLQFQLNSHPQDPVQEMRP